METTIAPTPADLQSATGTDTISMPGADTEQEKMFKFSEARIHLQRMVNSWDEEVSETERRRKVRKIDIDVKELRESGELDEDETLIPDRVIETNITREQPAYINYIKNSRRLAIFNCISNPEVNSQRIELEFTRGMTYTGWETPYFQNIDGAQTHGSSAIEVVFDTSKPFNVALEYIEHENLIFPKTCKNIQDAPRLIRALDISITKLREWVRKFDFSSEQVERLIEVRKDTDKENETVRVYKLFFKKEGIVYVGWFSLENGVSEWLLAPYKLFLGIKEKQTIPASIDPMTGAPIPASEQWVDSDIDMYPIFQLIYKESEQPLILDKEGRVFLDEHKQEAQTAVQSSYINGLTRASNIFASPASDDGSGSSLRELDDIKLIGGRVLSKPMNFWHPDYPDPSTLRALQWLDSANAEETNQVSFATMNRQDSRKTAKEIGVAQQKENLLNSVSLTLFSTHIRGIVNFSWRIVQSQALQGKIVFLQIKKQRPIINPITQQPVINPQTGAPDMQDYWENDYATISETWELRAAGDVDVIQKEETIMKMKQDWPVIANTPLAGVFLADMLRLQYPDTGERYAKLLQESKEQQTQSLIMRLSTVLDGLLKDSPQVAPEEQQQVMQLLQEAQQFSAQQQKPAQ